MKLIPSFGLKGRVKPFVIRDGKTVMVGPWTRNLWLDQGLNQIAETPICDCFAVAVKGTGTTVTTETVAGSNSYSIGDGTTTVTRTAGTRDFTVDDVGKLIQFTNGAEFTITAFSSATSVDVTPAADGAQVNEDITIYNVQQVGLTAEVSRTTQYSSALNENSTLTAGNVRTFERTFIFPSEDTITEVVPNTNTYSQTGTTVTRTAGTRDFVSGDVGSTITFAESGLTATITVFTGATTVTVGTSQTNGAQAITISKPNTAKVETPAGTNTYTRSGTTVTRAAGTRDFTSGDVGKIIYFITDEVQAIITAYTDATNVTVDVSGALSAQNIKLYGFTDYAEIGFSHSEEKTDNLNIRVLLSAPVRVYVSTPLQPSEQLKVTYECTLTVEPDTETSGNLSGVISDPGSLMSGNKAGKYAIESFATSTVSSSGETDISFADLEPFYDGYAAWSLNNDAIEPLANKVRENGVAFVGMTADTYVSGSFEKTFQGVFGLNDAISNNWRSLMIYDPESRNAIFTYLFNANQKKDGAHTFTISFKKAWGRDLT